MKTKELARLIEKGNAMKNANVTKWPQNLQSLRIA